MKKNTKTIKKEKSAKKVDKQQSISLVIIIAIAALLGLAVSYFVIRGDLVEEAKDNNSNVKIIEIGD